MAKFNDALVANGGRFAPSPSSYTANLIDTGQNAFGPQLRYLDAVTPPVFLPMQLIVTHVPSVFEYIDGGVELFKAVYETHLINFEGIDVTYTMDVDPTPLGRDSQVFNVPTRQIRSPINPTALFAEKIGNIIYNMHRFWMNAMHDPDTQAASLADLIPAGTSLPPHVASMYAADFMLIQYDTTYRPENVIDAIGLTNVFPTDIGPTGYALEPTTAKRLDRNITLNAIVQHNNNTVAIAKNLARQINIHQVNFQDAFPIANNVDPGLENDGLESLVANEYSQFQNLNGAVR